MSRHPDGDYYRRFARVNYQATLQERNDNRDLFYTVLRAVTLPFWLPLYVFDRFKQRRLMISLADEVARNRIVSERLVEELATMWVELQPHNYPLGKDDPKIDRVRKQFRDILERRRK